MIPTKEEYRILSDYLISIIDWERIYDDTASISKQKFTKEYIIKSLKKLISSYPDNFDTSRKGRIEANVSTFCMEKGLLNNYIFIISKGNNFGWYLTEDRLFKTIKQHKEKDNYCVIVNIKNILRNHKIKKICQTLKQTTNLIQE